MSREDELIKQINVERRQQLGDHIYTIVQEVIPFSIKSAALIIGLVVVSCLL